MPRDKHAYVWATPPAILGPLVIVIFVIVAVVAGFCAVTGRYPQAILACAAGAFFILVAIIDMIAEVIRHQKLILDELPRGGGAASR